MSNINQSPVMGLAPVITSLADTDAYKLTMLQAVLHAAPGVQTRFKFNCRSKVDLRPYAGEIRAQIAHLSTLKFTEEELEYFSRRRWFKPDLTDFLRTFRFNPDHVTVTDNGENLGISVAGTWAYVIMYEVLILAIVSEVYSRANHSPLALAKLYNLAEQDLLAELEKISRFSAANPGKTFRLIEFGTRRRFTREWQQRVVEIIGNVLPPENFLGTSNEDLARRYNLKAIGTMAHEFLQGHQALRGVTLRDSQRAALETWVQEYRGDLGIALTDVITMDAFLRDFDLFYAKLFDGLRHDSGDPYLWARKAIAHYQGLNLDPRDKALCFSDGLDVDRAIALCNEFEGQIKTSFGIGTRLTNNIHGVPALNIVLKMVECNGRPVAKISDTPGKSMCEDAGYLKYLTQVFGVEGGL